MQITETIARAEKECRAYIYAAYADVSASLCKSTHTFIQPFQIHLIWKAVRLGLRKRLAWAYVS